MSAPAPKGTERAVIRRDIQKSAARTFGALNNVDVLKDSVPLCTGAEWIHPADRPTLGPGSRRLFKTPIGVVADEEIIDWQDGEFLSYRIVRSVVPINAILSDYQGVTKVVPTGPDSCTLIWSMHYDPRPLARPFEPLIRAFLTKQIAGLADGVAASAL